MIDFKPVVDAIVAQLTPQIADAVIARIKAEGTGMLALEPGALEVPLADLLDGDSHAVDKLKAMVREEARDVVNDMEVPSEDSISDQVSNGVRDYLRENLDDAIDSAMEDADFVRDRDVEDNVDLENFDLFTDLRDRVDELDQQINKLVNGERPDTPSPFYVQGTDHLTDEFVTAVRVAMRHIINQDR